MKYISTVVCNNKAETLVSLTLSALNVQSTQRADKKNHFHDQTQEVDSKSQFNVWPPRVELIESID